MRYLRLRIARRQNLVYAAVAVLALGDVGIAGRRGLGVNAVVVSRLLVGMAGGADGLGRSGIVREGLDVGVAIGTAEDAVNATFKLGVIHMQADLLPVLVLGQSRIVMASEALVDWSSWPASSGPSAPPVGLSKSEGQQSKLTQSVSKQSSLFARRDSQTAGNKEKQAANIY